MGGGSLRDCSFVNNRSRLEFRISHSMALRVRLFDTFRLTSRLTPTVVPLRTTFLNFRSITTSTPQFKSDPEVSDLPKDIPASASTPIDIQALLRGPASATDSAAKKPSPNIGSILEKIPLDGESARRPSSIILDIIKEKSSFQNPTAASVKPSMAPYLGRSVATFNNVNAAYWRLNSILRQNNEEKGKGREKQETIRRDGEEEGEVNHADET
ncbi:hypothetical protein BC937DRAFT_86903 [Endogone sp. FLAS-F59071]|nr:hypothetical protein BC937DRAFT_86903 [Endogone sp. FLAS-F59071]|eukprot:RUS19800.1 hypothetical protein BC937DRAFT_86903 [Endogone sp. FLAS-F59071]